MLYDVLNQRHPDYRREVWDELELLYRGGYDLDTKSKMKLLPKLVGEHRLRYQERVKATQYINYFAQVVDFFASSLFAKTLHVTPTEETSAPLQPEPYDAFAEDATRGGDSIADVLKEAFTKALVKGKALVAIDFPATDIIPRNVAEAEALRIGQPYAWCVQPEQLIDWRYDDDGTFAWAILHSEYRERLRPEDKRSAPIERFKVWSRDPGGATWQVFERRKTETRAGGSEKLEPVASGQTSFRRVPLVELCVPHGLWVGNKIGPLAKEHFERRSKLLASVSKALMAIPYVKLGSEIPAAGGALPAEVQQDPERGDMHRLQYEAKGFVTLGAADDLGFAEPSGQSFELAQQQIDGLVDEMFRVGHQMAMSVTNTSKALARSGLSKTEDRHATEVVLEAFGNDVRKFAVTIYDTIAEARGDAVTWQPVGLDNFKFHDRAQVVDEGTRVRDIEIPSSTFQAHYFGDVARRLLPDLSPEDAAAVQDEIRESLDREAAQADQLLASLNPEDDDEDDDADGVGGEDPGRARSRAGGAGESEASRRRRDGGADAAGPRPRRAVARSRATT
ncbi:MAG: hypothetical protein AAF715_31975 [Myxococcota bacterium]